MKNTATVEDCIKVLKNIVDNYSEFGQPWREASNLYDVLTDPVALRNKVEQILYCAENARTYDEFAKQKQAKQILWDDEYRLHVGDTVYFTRGGANSIEMKVVRTTKTLAFLDAGNNTTVSVRRTPSTGYSEGHANYERIHYKVTDKWHNKWYSAYVLPKTVNF